MTVELVQMDLDVWVLEVNGVRVGGIYVINKTADRKGHYWFVAEWIEGRPQDHVYFKTMQDANNYAIQRLVERRLS